jgi:hypothetical protein
MEGSENPKPECNAIDEDTIELHAMGRLEDGPIRQHLETCDFCKARITEQKAYLEILKRGLNEF